MNRFSLVAATLAVCLFALLPAAPSQAGGIGKVRQLRNAPIPASCGHAATTLDGYSKNFGTYSGFASLLTKKARFGHLKGVKGKVAAVPLVCSAGGVSWPEMVLLYRSHKRLIGYVDLRKLSTAQEHEDVQSLRFHQGKIHVRWRGYEGAGFTFTTYRGTIGWKKGHRTWWHSAPLTIDYAKGRYSSDLGAGVINSASDTSAWLYPAPKAFRSFIRHRWNKLASYSDCQYTDAKVTVNRFSHKGFASGSELYCGGAQFVWGRVHGKWRVLFGYQDGPYCQGMSKLNRRAMHVLGLSCMDTKAPFHTHQLGHWPKSGQ